jgi:ABC-type Zn2+ transport system substrate-binding protein/surface adhesin
MPHGDHDKDHDRDHDGDRDRDHDKDNDHPRTSIYSFVGAENVCGAVGPLGPTGCDYNNVKSIAWNGDAVNVALVQANPTGPAIVKNLTIPLSKFVPLAK